MSADVSTKLKEKWQEQKFVCIGLDPYLDKIPNKFKGSISENIFEFNKFIIDQTSDLVCAYKLNSAFYEAQGLEGRKALEQTIKYLRENHPEIVMILDAKRGDIANTNSGYVKDAFDNLQVDAITVSPYLGKESLKPFLDRNDKGIMVLVKTSNEGSAEFQNLEVGGKPLYEVIAEHAKNWNTNNNVSVVVGATYPKELKAVRDIVGNMPILIPGVGAQGGSIKEITEAGLDINKEGIIVSSSRGII